MIISLIKRQLYEKLYDNAKKSLGRDLKPHEKEDFINRYEHKIEDVLIQTSHAFNTLINSYLQELDDEDSSF